METNSFYCPRCHSDNTQSARLVVAEGTTSGSGTIFILDSQNDVDVGVMNTVTQTSVASALDPGPYPSSFFWNVLAAALVVGLVCWWMSVDGVFGLGCAGLVALAALILISGLFRIGPRRSWPARYARFLRQWFCHRCGIVWERS
jgi:hypothetical protein